MDSQPDESSSVFSQGTFDVILSEVMPGGQKVMEFIKEAPALEQDIKMEVEEEDPLGEPAAPPAPSPTAHPGPPPTGVLPSTQEFLGLYGFDFSLDSTGKPNWVYSEDLDYLFIDMNKVLLLEFRLGGPRRANGGSLRVRALPTYNSFDFAHDPVERCVMHALEDDPRSQAHEEEMNCRCSEFSLAGHVLRCDTPNACYHHDSTSGRHSVSVPVPPSAPSFCVPFRFVCKTSCPRGMMRRHLKVIFTLEDISSGEVVGRRTLPVKICSCPKRDKERMEREEWQSETRKVLEGMKGRRKRLIGKQVPASPLPTRSPSKARRLSSAATAGNQGDRVISEEELKRQRLNWISNMKSAVADLLKQCDDFGN